MKERERGITFDSRDQKPNCNGKENFPITNIKLVRYNLFLKKKKKKKKKNLFVITKIKEYIHKHVNMERVREREREVLREGKSWGREGDLECFLRERS